MTQFAVRKMLLLQKKVDYTKRRTHDTIHCQKNAVTPEEVA